MKAPESSDIMVTYPGWHTLVDEEMEIKISGFYKANNAMVEPMCVNIHNMKIKGQPVI